MPSRDDNSTARRDGAPTASRKQPGRRPYNADAARVALLAAATALFDERGFDATTTREIGERAGVDPAMIKRYYGSKEGLYIATLADAREPTDGLSPATLIGRLLDKSDQRRHTPMTVSMVSPSLNDSVRAHIESFIADQLTRPFTQWVTDRDGTDEPADPDTELRAELLVAMCVGIALSRASGTMRALTDVDADTIQATLEPVFAALQNGPVTPPGS
jgi:AcrR family transcriptional regulator